MVVSTTLQNSMGGLHSPHSADPIHFTIGLAVITALGLVVFKGLNALYSHAKSYIDFQTELFTSRTFQTSKPASTPSPSPDQTDLEDFSIPAQSVVEEVPLIQHAVNSCYLASLTQAILLKDPRFEENLRNILNDQGKHNKHEAARIFLHIIELGKRGLEISVKKIESFRRGLVLIGALNPEDTGQHCPLQMFDYLFDFCEISRIKLRSVKNMKKLNGKTEMPVSKNLSLDLSVAALSLTLPQKDEKLDPQANIDKILENYRYVENKNNPSDEKHTPVKEESNGEVVATYQIEKETTQFLEAPPYLTLHFGRRVYPHYLSGSVGGIQEFLKIPGKHFVDGKEAQYRLISSIRHQGHAGSGEGGGHYTASVRTKSQHYLADDMVSERKRITKTRFLEEGAESYMLFYEKIP